MWPRPPFSWEHFHTKPEDVEKAAAFRCASSERHLCQRIFRSSYLASFSLPHSPCQLVYVLSVDLGDIDQLIDGDVLIGLVLDLLLVGPIMGPEATILGISLA